MALSFKGGMKIKKHKGNTLCAPPRHVEMPGEHVFPLDQYTEAVILPTVKVGESVKAGQKIADAEDYLAVPLHSSVSGRVTRADGREIAVESDGKYTAEEIKTASEPDKYTTLELLWIIRDAGVTEPDGEPAHIKLNPPGSVKFLIADCAESDMYVTSKQSLIENYPEDILRGLKTAMRILNVKESCIGIEAHMGDCFNGFKRLLRYDSSVHLLKLKSKYPQSDETQLIKAVTGLDTPIGSVVLDARTLYDISRAVYCGESVTRRVVTVSGGAVKEPANFIAPLGVSVSFLLDCAGGITRGDAEIFSGGGIKHENIGRDAPITKNTEAILALAPPKSENPEKRCGICVKCIGKCPMRLNPRLLSSASDWEKAENNFISDCSACGLCSYVCPKRRNPLKKIYELKNKYGKSE